MKVMLEMRPAFDGHSGIPQETRLLFRGLAALADVKVIGLLQSGNLVIEEGLPTDGQALGPTERIDRLSKVVVSLQQGASSHIFEHLRKKFLKLGGPAVAALRGAVGLRTPLSGFDATHFKDFVWRSMFEKSLPVADLDAVTSQDFRVMRWPWSIVNAVGVASAAFGRALYPRLDTRGVDVFVSETPYPGRVARGTRLVVRYHDAIPLLMPHTIKDRGYHRTLHYQALRRNAADGAWFACVSDSTRQDLLSVMPELDSRCVTIPNMISSHFVPESAPADRVPEIVWGRKNRNAPAAGGMPLDPAQRVDGRVQFLLMVSTIEPRKNHRVVLDAWELLRTTRFPNLQLVFVGALGWDHAGILQRLEPWLHRGGLHLLQDVPSDDLRLLYRHAAVTVCPSLSEGFDFSGVEAMASGGTVAASDIRVHREIYEDAAEYFSPYSVEALVGGLSRLLEPGATPLRESRGRRGQEVAARYLPANVLPAWADFLGRVTR